jgi:hypothetical protein
MANRDEYLPGEFCWADLMTADLERAKRFYAGLFGWTAEDQDTQGGPPYVQFMHGGRTAAGMGVMNEAMRAAGAPCTWNTYVQVSDVGAATDTAAGLGASVVLPVMQVVEAGWMSIIQDPEGAYISLWQPVKHAGAGWAGDPGGACWFELATRDPEGAKQFYGDLFGWTYRASHQAPTSYAVVQCGGVEQGGMIEMNEEWEGMPPCWGVYFEVADIAAAVEKVPALGGHVEVAPFEVPEVATIAVVADDQGAFFYLMRKASS